MHDLLLAAFESSPIGMCLLDVDGTLVRMNAALVRLLGVNPSQDLPCQLADLIRARPASPRDLRVPRADGTAVWVRVRAFPVLGDGAVTFVGAVVEDLTDARSLERRFEALVERSAERYTVLTPDCTILYMSPLTAATLDVQPGDKLPIERLHPSDVGTARQTFARTIADARESHHTVTRVRMTGRGWRTMDVTMTNMLDDPAVGGIVFNSRDVTELRAAQARFEAMVERSADTYSLLAPDFTLVYAPPSSRLAATPPGEQVSLDIIHPADRTRVRAAFDCVVAGNPSAVTVRYRVAAGPRGRWMHVDTVFTNLLDHPAVGAIMLNSRNVTEEVAADAAFAHRAYHDELTGLANRVSVVDRLRAAVGQSVVAEMLDLDLFKLINDTYGHAVGDDLLRQIGQRLTATVAPDHTVARLGGDEFVVVADGLSEAGATDLARRIAAAVSAPTVLSTGDQVIVTASIGIATGVGGNPDSLLREADTALYRAKDRGRDCWQVFDRQLRHQSLARHQTEQRMRRALAGGGFRLKYQPIVDLRTGRIVEVEALLRMDIGDPEPAVEDMIKVAEQTGLIVDIGERALRESCRQAAQWQAGLGAAAPRSIAVNVSARQLDAPDFAREVAAAIADAGLPPDCLCLELTETTLLEADRRITETLFALKDTGVQLAIDDFGTGYSSLTYLKRFPIDIVKIDRSFVRGVGTDPNDAEIVRAVIGLGQALGLRTIAEGVEHGSQATALRALGCDRAQGFFYSPALAADALGQLLGHWPSDTQA